MWGFMKSTKVILEDFSYAQKLTMENSAGLLLLIIGGEKKTIDSKENDLRIKR